MLQVASLELPSGANTVTALYSGDAAFNGSSGSTTVTVTGPASGSAVALSISPNPVPAGLPVLVSLTEDAGVATTLTGWTDNGTDNSSMIATFFGTTIIPAHGQLVTYLILSSTDNGPWVFSGQDTGGAAWSQTVNVQVTDPLKQGNLVLSVAPATVLQNTDPAAAACPWSTLLTLQETAGFGVDLATFQDNTTGLSADPQQLFGTYHIAGFGTLRAVVCPANVTPSLQAIYGVGGTDLLGNPVNASATASFAGPAHNAGTFAVSPATVTLSTWNERKPSTFSLALTSTGSGSQWTASVFPSNAATTWLTVTPTSGSGSARINIAANAMGLGRGVYYANILLQATNAFPQYLEVPVVFIIGDTGMAEITAAENSATFLPGPGAPGMMMSIFGSNLSSFFDMPFGPPYLLGDQGVSATVNGVGAPLFYVSPEEVDIQIPYEIGTGPALLAISNSHVLVGHPPGSAQNGFVATYWIQVVPASPGIFTDGQGNLLDGFGDPASVKPGDVLTFDITGDGDQAPPGIATGQSPSFGTPLTAVPTGALPLSVTVGGVPATVTFHGITPFMVAETEVTITVPPVAVGPQQVVVTVGGVQSPPATVTILAGK